MTNDLFIENYIYSINNNRVIYVRQIYEKINKIIDITHYTYPIRSSYDSVLADNVLTHC